MALPFLAFVFGIFGRLCFVTVAFLGYLYLIHRILVDSSTVIYETSPFVILGVSGLFCSFHSIFLWKILLANTVDPNKTPQNVASDLGLHCLPMNLLRGSR